MEDDSPRNQVVVGARRRPVTRATHDEDDVLEERPAFPADDVRFGTGLLPGAETAPGTRATPRARVRRRGHSAVGGRRAQGMIDA